MRDTFRWTLAPEEERDHTVGVIFDERFSAFARALQAQVPGLDIDKLRNDFKRIQGTM